MKKLKQDLKAVSSELKKLVKKIDSLAANVNKMEKARAAKAKAPKKIVAKKPAACRCIKPVWTLCAII